MPPLPLANRVGSLAEAEDPYAFYEEVGADTRKQILRMLPPGYELEGRRLLDFGCGAGRTLRHFLDEADSAEIWGCDIDQESIDWLERNLCPPLHALRNEAAPGLPFEDGHFDLVWALSVFTHLADDAWAAWMLELHRVLADDGILIATSIGPHHSERYRQGGLGGGPHRHERASPLGLLGGRRASGPSLHLVAACALGPSLRDPRDRRVAACEMALVQPSLAGDAKARRHPHRRGSRAPRARRAARAHRRAPPRPAVAARARGRSRHRRRCSAARRASASRTAAARAGPAAARAGQRLRAGQRRSSRSC